MDAAAAGEQWAWTTLVSRFEPMVLSVAKRHRLAHAEREEVAQQTWVRLFRNIGRIETPAALGGWVATTARREALRILRATRREIPVEGHLLPEAADEPDMEAELVARERHDALNRALDGVSSRQRDVTRMLMTEPAPSYDEISAALGIPVGSIGPTRARCIARLRTDGHLARVVDTTPTSDHTRGRDQRGE